MGTPRSSSVATASSGPASGRSPGPEPALVPVSAAEALRALAPSTLFQLAGDKRAKFQALAALGTPSPIVQQTGGQATFSVDANAAGASECFETRR